MGTAPYQRINLISITGVGIESEYGEYPCGEITKTDQGRLPCHVTNMQLQWKRINPTYYPLKLAMLMGSRNLKAEDSRYL